MSEGTTIQWADDTHNFWRGCTKVSAGCTNCYAEKLVTTRLGGEWGKGKPRVRVKDFEAPLRWNRRAWVCDTCGTDWPAHPFACCGTAEFHRRRVFSLSLGDWLDEEVPIEWLADMLRVIHECPNLDWLLLTKRPGNWRTRLQRVLDANSWGETDPEWVGDWIDGIEAPPNIWLGVSVENQATADERIPQLLKIPAAVRFLSVEPLLEAVDLRLVGRGSCRADKEPVTARQEPRPTVDWVIVGGESGPGARLCNVEWIRDVVRQCKAAGVPCFVKQLGSKPMCEEISKHGRGINTIQLVLRHPKGGDPAEWPEDLRVREFPQVSREGAKEAK